jgi:hypothetical protein
MVVRTSQLSELARCYYIDTEYEDTVATLQALIPLRVHIITAITDPCNARKLDTETERIQRSRCHSFGTTNVDPAIDTTK